MDSNHHTSPPRTLAFRKMHGLGNDFVILDSRMRRIELDPAHVRAIADRRRGVGCDQLIVIEPSLTADARMRIYNRDGGEVAACGNATRCVGSMLLDESRRAAVALETAAGTLQVATGLGGIAVDMGPPRWSWREIPLADPVAETPRAPTPADLRAAWPALPAHFAALSMGNPHAVFFAPAADIGFAATIEAAWSRIGPAIETHPLFPERVNASCALVLGRDRVRLTVWERGAGATLACGTAACAALAAGRALGFLDPTATIALPGGELTISEREDGHIVMAGAIASAFSGTLDLADLVGADAMRRT